MDEDVEPGIGAVRLAPAREHPLDLGVVLDVARLHEGRPDRVRQRPHPAFDQALDGAEAERRALGMERARDAPRDRMVVGDAEDQRVAAVEQSHSNLRVTVPEGYAAAVSLSDAPRGARLSSRRGRRHAAGRGGRTRLGDPSAGPFARRPEHDHRIAPEDHVRHAAQRQRGVARRVRGRAGTGPRTTRPRASELRGGRLAARRRHVREAHPDRRLGARHVRARDRAGRARRDRGGATGGALVGRAGLAGAGRAAAAGGGPHHRAPDGARGADGDRGGQEPPRSARATSRRPPT